MSDNDTSAAGGQHGSALEALIAAQLEFPEIPKDCENKHYQSRYSSLDAIVSSCRPVLNKHNFLFNQLVEKTESGWICTAQLVHVSGEVFANSVPLTSNFADLSPQAKGSELTYARRYASSPLLGITSDQDDDGNATLDKQPKGEGRQSRSGGAPSGSKKPSLKMQIDAATSAAELASVVSAEVGRRPVKEHAEEWKKIGVAVKQRLDSAGWTPEQNAVVEAVLSGIRNQLKVDPPAAASPTPAAPAPQSPQAAAPTTAAPPLERIAAWLDQQETPGDLAKAIDSIDSSDRFASLRADAALAGQVLVHAHRLLQMKVELGDWTEDAARPAHEKIVALDEKFQSIETFGGGEAAT